MTPEERQKENRAFGKWFETINYDPNNKDDPTGEWYPIIRWYAWKAWIHRASVEREEP